MLYNYKYSFLAVTQYNDYSYIYIEENKYFLSPLDCPVNLITNNFIPIGPTILVEWEDDLH